MLKFAVNMIAIALVLMFMVSGSTPFLLRPPLVVRSFNTHFSSVPSDVELVDAEEVNDEFSSWSGSGGLKAWLLEFSAMTLRGTQPPPPYSDSRFTAEEFEITLNERLGDTFIGGVGDSGMKGAVSQAGRWSLVYSTSPEGLFRSSPFFLTGRAVCKTEEDARKFSWFCQMHRKALAISRIGRVEQIITDEGEVINEFNTIVGSVPFSSRFGLSYSGGWPVQIEGCITSTGTMDMDEDSNMYIGMDNVRIRGSNIPLLRQLLDSDGGFLDTKQLASFIKSVNSSYENPKAILTPIVLSPDVRIVMDEDGIYYAYVRVSDDVSLENFDNRDADLGLLNLLEGINDNILRLSL